MASSIKFMAAAAGLYALSTQPPLNQVRTLASMRSAVDSACLVLYKTAAGTGRCAPSFPLGRGERRACTGAVAVHASQQAARRFVRRRICCLHFDGSSVLHGCTVACRAMQAAHRSNSSTVCRLTLWCRRWRVCARATEEAGWLYALHVRLTRPSASSPVTFSSQGRLVQLNNALLDGGARTVHHGRRC